MNDEIYTLEMSKHLIDLDERALADAKAALGTSTMRDTVNQSLRLAAEQTHQRVDAALSSLAEVDFDDRDDAWR